VSLTVGVICWELCYLVQWHLGFFTEDYTPNRRGFDSFYGYYQGKEDYFDHTYAAGWPDHVSNFLSYIIVSVHLELGVVIC